MEAIAPCIKADPAQGGSARGSRISGIQCLAMSEPTAEELKARIAELEQKLTSRRSKNLEFRVSEKGGVSVYGLGRFPVTLYYEQWTRLLGAVDELRAFIDENKSKLKTKDAE